MAMASTLVLTLRIPMRNRITLMTHMPHKYAVRRPTYGITQNHEMKVANRAIPFPPTFRLYVVVELIFRFIKKYVLL